VPILLDPPLHGFASDNNAGVHPAVLAAIEAANVGHVRAYGDDPWTAACADRFRDLFGAQAETFLVWSGTGGNVMAIATLHSPAGAIVCTDAAHIAVDETGAAERIIGAKLIDLPAPDGKLVPDQLLTLAHLQGDVHHVQPAILSLTQSTELGTLYSVDEVAALCDTAHAMGMLVHMDGARIANAVAALGGTHAALRATTVDAGVDVITFGGTKNGLLCGEAVVFLTPGLTRYAGYIRKQVNQLPSKMRFIAAQVSALLEDDLWIANAVHANAMAGVLFDQVGPSLGLQVPPVVNSLYPVLDPAHAKELADWSFFYDWDVHANTVRWMTAWDTTAADIDTFAAAVRAVTTSSV
jgi:threonine aldolase